MHLIFGVFVNKLTAQSYITAVRAVNAGDVPDGGGLAGTVGANQTVNRALGHRKSQTVQSLEGSEGLSHIL